MPRTAVCAVCESNIRLTLDGVFAKHNMPSGLPEDSPFAYQECQGSGASPTEALRIARTFFDWRSKDISVEVFDGGDCVSVVTQTYVVGQSIQLSVDVKGSEVRKLIARLTEIADARGF